jgi:hypothetical protein
MSVAHSHGWERTKVMPSRISRRAERPPVSAGTERTRSAQMHAALTANVPASTRKAPPAPMAATTNPPIAGPSRRWAA